MNKLFRLIFWISISFIIIGIFSLILSPNTNIEFKNNNIRDFFYFVVYGGITIAILLTLFGTIKKRNSKLKNITITITTIVISGLFLIISFYLSLTMKYIRVHYDEIIYQKISDNITIHKQEYTRGVYSPTKIRIVKLTPILFFWTKVEDIDTVEINKYNRYYNTQKIN